MSKFVCGTEKNILRKSHKQIENKACINFKILSFVCVTDFLIRTLQNNSFLYPYYNGLFKRIFFFNFITQKCILKDVSY